MVILGSWWSEPLSNGKRSEGPMNGEGFGLRVPSPVLAGYQKTDEDREVFGKDCPWCTANGQANILRSYAINFEESITLCTSLQCLYSLVSRPLDNIRATLSSAQDFRKGCKRKSDLSGFSNQQTLKQQKAELSNVSEGNCVEVIYSNVSPESCEDQQREIGNDDNGTCTKVNSVSEGDSGSSKPVACIAVESTRGETCKALQEDITDQDLIELVPTRPHLFWENTDNLCWLDSLLVALVNLKALAGASRKSESLVDNSPSNIVKNLYAKYHILCAYLKTKEHRCQENIVRVPSDDLQKIEQDLADLRQSVFQLLLPKLQCELGQQETPVSALPLLLKADDWANIHFQHIAQWEFKCSSCGYDLNTRVEKTVTTFPQVMTDWHPLKAVHRAQCNSCLRKNQRRTLVLQRISSVFVLHFVEGLPRRDISKYSFEFQGSHYKIRALVQYNKRLKHFVTWIHQPDKSWLEFDDLKHPNCITHKRLTLPANQFHLVFWEAELQTDSLFPEPLCTADTLESCSKGDSFEHIISKADDTGIVEALTENEDKNEVVNPLDSSIGSTTLLDTFEGLSHSDIVTLTLVEVNVDVEGKPLPNIKEPVVGPTKSTVTNVSPLLPETTCFANKKRANAEEILSAAEDIFPSAVKPSASAPVEPTQEIKYSPTVNSSNPNASNVSVLAKRHFFHQSTPFRVPFDPSPEFDLKCESNEALPAKPAELFGGYKVKKSPNPVSPEGCLTNQLVKPSTVSLPKKLFICPDGISAPVKASVLAAPKCAGKDTTKLSPLMTVSATDALRLKLMKKLKAKKKKLAKLNQILSKEESESTPRPDSTDVCSPHSVTSSTSAYDSPAFENFFAELLSPAQTASNLSPDSTDYLDKLTKGRCAETPEGIPQEILPQAKMNLSASVLPEPLLNNPSSTNDDFLEELISGSRLEPSTVDNADLNALDMFF